MQVSWLLDTVGWFFGPDQFLGSNIIINVQILNRIRPTAQRVLLRRARPCFRHTVQLSHWLTARDP